MAQPSLRPPVYLQPRSKAIPTSSNSSVTANATSKPLQSQSRYSSPTRSIPSAHASNRAAIALIRRVLCSHVHAGSDQRPIEELLPPLTSSNDVDLQLYALIAIVVKDLVQGWYGKITPDQGFVEELVRIVAHCTRALEQRLRSVDLEGLIFDEIPELVENHILAYRVSHRPVPLCLSTNPQVVYHQLNPHPAMSPVPDPTDKRTVKEQQENEAAYRQLIVQGALAVLLPTEELENACVRTLIADVVGETILGNIIGGKGCEGPFIWNNIIKVVEMIKARQEPKATGKDLEVDNTSQLDKFGLLSADGQSKKSTGPSHLSKSSKIFWQLLQYGYLIFSMLRLAIVGLFAASSRTSRASSTPGAARGIDPPPIAKPMEPPTTLRPILRFKFFSLISVLLNLPLRMPWLSGCFSLLQYQLIHGPWEVGATDGLIDRYIHHNLQTHFSPPILLPQLLLSLRTTLFPHSSLLPPPSTPPQETSTIKSTCARSLRSLFPPRLLAHFFASPLPEDWDRAIEAELDIWSDGYLNRHLTYAVLELVVVRVLPELGEKGVRALMEGRGVDI